MDAESDRPPETYFAPAGRQSQHELALEIQSWLDDSRLQVLLEAVTGFVAVLNPQRQIIAANQELLRALHRTSAECLVGLRPGEALNCVHFTEGTDGCGTARHCQACGAVLTILAAQTRHHPVDGECRLSMYQDGQLTALDLRVRATPVEVKGVQLIAAVLYDVSALKRREVLEEVFLHDVLNVIAGIYGWTALLPSDVHQEAAQQITTLMESLREEVMGQRTLLAAERGDLVTHANVIPVAALFAKIESIFTHHPVAEGRILTVAAPAAAEQITSDQSLLIRILSNMLKNAYEATPPGGEVRLSFARQRDSVSLLVHNPGVIPEQVQLRLFERSFSTKSQQGRGLGTYSMKLYGERYLGGKVGFTSTEQEGTTFSLTLPELVPRGDDGESKEMVAAPRPLQLRVLFIDDQEAILRLGEMMLKRMGHSVQTFAGGKEALAAFRADPASYDVIVTDWNMPGLSGEPLVRELTAVRPDIAVAVCTGMGEATDWPADLPVRHVVHKPFTLQELGRALEACSPGRPPSR